METKYTIDINGTYCYLETSMDALLSKFTENYLLVDHPDQTAKQSAMMLVERLVGKGILSDKAEAIIGYHKAFNEISPYLTKMED